MYLLNMYILIISCINLDFLTLLLFFLLVYKRYMYKDPQTETQMHTTNMHKAPQTSTQTQNCIQKPWTIYTNILNN